MRASGAVHLDIDPHQGLSRRNSVASRNSGALRYSIGVGQDRQNTAARLPNGQHGLKLDRPAQILVCKKRVDETEHLAGGCELGSSLRCPPTAVRHLHVRNNLTPLRQESEHARRRT